MASQMLWDPIRFDETCPSSDGACAMVIGNEEIADARVADGHPVAWIHATALRTEPLAYSGPRPGQPAGRPRRRGGAVARRGDHRARSTRSTSPRSTSRSPGSSRCGWRTSASPPRARAGSSPRPARPRSAAASRSTRPAACCRRNPIGASGMIRFAESAIQVMGKAGDHQVEGARKALGHAYGGGSQYYSMWVVGSDKPATSRDTHEVHRQRRDEPARPADRDRQDRRGSRLRHRSRCRTRCSTWRSSPPTTRTPPTARGCGTRTRRGSIR